MGMKSSRRQAKRRRRRRRQFTCKYKFNQFIANGKRRKKVRWEENACNY